MGGRYGGDRRCPCSESEHTFLPLFAIYCSFAIVSVKPVLTIIRPDPDPIITFTASRSAGDRTVRSLSDSRSSNHRCFS